LGLLRDKKCASAHLGIFFDKEKCDWKLGTSPTHFFVADLGRVLSFDDLDKSGLGQCLCGLSIFERGIL